MKITFKQANPKQIDQALNLLFGAAQMLKEKGVNQWAFWLNPDQEKISWIKEGFSKQEFYFVENENKDLLGMFRLMTEDEMYWGKQDKNAVYIHSLVVKKEYAGKKIGQKILEQIEINLQKEGISILRLDCNAASQGLCKYYEQRGFKKVGEKQMPHSLNNLYEKTLPN